MDDFSEEKAFSVDEVDAILKEAIETTIQNATYSHQKVSQWTSNTVEHALKRLTALNKPFKYVGIIGIYPVTCTIMQKNGAGLHCASSCYWDNATDGSTSYKYESKTMNIIVNVYGLAI